MVITATTTAEKIGETPLYIIGRNRNSTHTMVKPSPITDAAPFFPPIRIIARRNTAIIKYKENSRSALYTDAMTSPCDSLTSAMTFIPFLQVAPNR